MSRKRVFKFPNGSTITFSGSLKDGYKGQYDMKRENKKRRTFTPEPNQRKD